MNQEAIDNAVTDAKRFLRTVEAYQRRKMKEAETRGEQWDGLYIALGSRERAMRRAGMDLSRALSAMRQP